VNGSADPFNLQRFLAAQAPPVYDRVRDELRNSEKQTHWMWFIFPQIAGLGSSSTARFYAIASLAEAEAFLTHPLLGTRLGECTRLVLQVSGKTAFEIFGSPDDVKFRSCMTLFDRVTPNDGLFDRALAKYFNGERDPRTLELLGS
jgi:uncharacterized protein (DUF1810 family)